MMVHPVLLRVAHAVYLAEYATSRTLGASRETAMFSAYLAYCEVHEISFGSEPVHYQTTVANIVTGKGRP